MAAPVTVRFREVVSPSARANVSIAVIGTRGSGGTVNHETLTLINEANKGILGTDGQLLNAYNIITAHSSPNFYALPWDDSGNTQADAASQLVAINALVSAQEKAKIDGFSPDIVVFPVVGSDSSNANANITALKGHVSQASGRIAAAFLDAARSTQADAITWSQNNGGDGIIGVTNDSVSGAGDGAIRAAAHYLRYIAAENIAANPIGIRYPLAGASTPTPSYAWAVEDASAPAEALDDEFLTTIISYFGGHYLWGGKMRTAVSGSPLGSVGHRLVAFTIAKDVTRLLLPLIGPTLSTSDLETFQANADDAVERYINSGEAADVQVALPTYSGSTISSTLQIFFHGIPDAAELDIEVDHATL